jgi:hypothetical protein
MTRGRKPLMALREAVLIAKKRGETRQFMHEPGLVCNFVIYGMGFVAHVRIKRVTRVHCSHAWIERETADALATLRAIASGTGISRELWVYLPRGAFRFFRVTDTGLIELNRDGSVMPEKTGPAIRKLPAPAQPAPAEAGVIPPVLAPSTGEPSSKNCPGQNGRSPSVFSSLKSDDSSGRGMFSNPLPHLQRDEAFSNSSSEEGSHVGEDPSEKGKGG